MNPFEDYYVSGHGWFQQLEREPELCPRCGALLLVIEENFFACSEDCKEKGQ